MSRIHRIKRFLRGGGLFLAVYLGVYFLNAAFGGYDPYYTSDGRRRYGSGLLVHDCVMWQPRFGSYYNEHRFDFLGFVFYPLLRLDYAYFHTTHSTRDDDFSKWWTSLSEAGIHPKYRSDYARWKMIGAKYEPELTAAESRGDMAEAKRIRKLIREESVGVAKNK